MKDAKESERGGRHTSIDSRNTRPAVLHEELSAVGNVLVTKSSRLDSHLVPKSRRVVSERRATSSAELGW
jgi:hypothetical protein